MHPNIIDLSSQSDTIQISAGEKLILLSNGTTGNLKKKIILGENSECCVYGFFSSGSHSIDIVHAWAGSRSFVGCTLFSSEENTVDMKILSTITASNSVSDIRVLSLAGPKGSALIDGSILIGEWVIKAEWSLHERHVFLWSSGKIRGIPALLVHSDDVKAHHSLAIERISDEELFYLRSRGFSRDEATIVMLESSIIDVFSSFGHRFPEECRTVVGKIMEHIHESISLT